MKFSSWPLTKNQGGWKKSPSRLVSLLRTWDLGSIRSSWMRSYFGVKTSVIVLFKLLKNKDNFYFHMFKLHFSKFVTCSTHVRNDVSGGGCHPAVVVFLSHEDVAVIAPQGGPRVLNQPVYLDTTRLQHRTRITFQRIGFIMKCWSYYRAF